MVTIRDKSVTNPFPGLRPFDTEESDFFFGREEDSEEVFNKLLENKFITLIGAPGIGKSSLINCGVLPKIINNESDKISVRKIISFRPGNDPFGNLSDALSKDISDAVEKAEYRNSIRSGFSNPDSDISSLVNNFIVKSGEKVLLIIDQLEDIFRSATYAVKDSSHDLNSRFADFLVEVIRQAGSEMLTILTIRSDYIGDCALYPGLNQVITRGIYLVPHLVRHNYREAIEGPVKVTGASIDEVLVETILDDIENLPWQLHLFQHALMRTWEHWKELDEPGRPIGVADYESIGTMRSALSLDADAAFEELSTEQQEICTLIFKIITGKRSDKRGFRQPTDIKTIKSVAGCSNEELFPVIEKFRSRSRPFLCPSAEVPLSDETIIDICDENLIILWDRLQGWIDDEADSAQMYKRLSELSALYQKGKTGLLKQPDLQNAINWRDKHKPTLAWAQQFNPAFERTMVYLRTSEREYIGEEENKSAEKNRQMRRIRLISFILGITVVLTLGFMLNAFIRKMSAEENFAFARMQGMKAERERAVADSSLFVAIGQRAKADSNASVAIRRAEEARLQKEIAEMEKSLAETLSREATYKQTLAEKQYDSAIRAGIISDQNARIATEQKIAALRLRMLAVGKSMSVRSLQLQGQKDLQALLAYQAYLFNNNNNGPENDADIYAGLYNVIRQSDNSVIKSFKGHQGLIKSIAFVPGENEFFTSGIDGKVLKWSLEGEENTFQVIYSGSDIIEVLAVSPDASWLACGGADAKIRMLPLKGNTLGYEMAGHKGKIRSLFFSYDGKSLYSSALDGKVLKWDIATRTSTNVADGSVQITSIDISTGGNYLAGIKNDGGVIVWNPESSSDKFSINTEEKNITVLKFNPESNILALGDATGNVELWDIELRKKVSEVKAHSSRVNDIKFNPSLEQMATASDDKTLKIYNIANPADLSEPPVTLSDNEGFVLVMQFSPDGQLIISGTSEGSQNIISRPSNVSYLANNICDMVARNMTQEEWNQYVGKDIPLEKTCQEKSFNIRIDPKK